MSSAPCTFLLTQAVKRCDIIVLGAGPAGIAAARHLKSKTNLSVIVVEARQRVGGRTHTSDELGVGLPLDHGGKWVHGACSENRIMQVLKECGAEEECDLGTRNRKGRVSITRLFLPDRGDPSKEDVLFRGGRTVDPSQNARRALNVVFEKISRLAYSGDPEQDMSLEELLYETYSDCIPTDAERSGYMSERDFYCNMIKKILSESKKNFDIMDKDFLDEVVALLNMKICRFFEAFEGSPINKLSAKYGMKGSELPGGNHNIPFGYGEFFRRLGQPLVDDGTILLGHGVVSVETDSSWVSRSDLIRVRTKLGNGDEKTFRASSCIVALPLGVLKSSLQSNGHIVFDPTLPDVVSHAIMDLGIAVMNKLELAFDSRWWPEDVGSISIASCLADHTPTLHPFSIFFVESATTSSDPGKPNILVCYMTGEFATRAERWDDDEIVKRCMETFKKSGFSSVEGFEENVPSPISVHMTRWLRDPFSRGSWTFFAKNSGPHSMGAFRDEECERRGLFFAGEHTCDGSYPGLDIGCAHGAWLSGELAAEKALESISYDE